MYTVGWQKDSDGLDYIVLDIRECETKEFSKMLEDSGSLIRKMPPKSVLLLALVSGKTPIFTDMEGFQKYLKQNQPYMKASAAAIMDPLRKAMFEGVVALSKRAIKVTSTIEEALDYLKSVK